MEPPSFSKSAAESKLCPPCGCVLRLPSGTPRNCGCTLASFVQKAEQRLGVLGGLECGVQSLRPSLSALSGGPRKPDYEAGGCGVPVDLGELRPDGGVFPQAPMKRRTPHIR